MKQDYERRMLSACADCVYMDANGPSDLDMETAKRCSDGFERAEIVALCWVYDDDDDEGAGEPIHGFSMSRCDVCGTTLGGERYACEYITREEMGA